MNDEELKEMLKLYTKKDLNEKTVEYWQNEYSQLKQQCQECKHLNKKIELNIKNKLMNEIQQLKQQLAEKNELFIATKWRADDLEKQLAEKEKESSVLKAVIDKNKTGQFGAVNICNAISEFYEPLVKDMIIAEMEKVKEKVLKIDKTEIKTLENGYSTLYVDRPEIITIIDQQISELKGEK